MHTLTLTTAGEIRVNNWPLDLLQHAYREIGCSCVTTVALGASLTLWCDDEGLLASAPQANQLATSLCIFHDPLQSVLVGNVVITGGVDAEGDTHPLTPDQVAALLGVLEGLCDASARLQ